jgi:hypothetical protein
MALENPGNGKGTANQAAEDTVFDNLGLTREDLGMDQDTGSGNEDLDQGGSGNEDLGGRDEPDLFDQRAGVSHTEQRQPQRLDPAVPRPKSIPDYAEVHPDNKGNLVNGDGIVVARAGKEARMYQDLHKTRGQAQTLHGQLTDVTGRLKKAVEIGQGLHRDLQAAQAQVNAVKQFGLDQGEHLTALRLFKELRDNPQQALKNILTRAATNGINMSELGLTPGGVDPKSLVDMIKQEIGTAVNPLRERTEAERRHAQAQAQDKQRLSEIQTQVDGFFGQNPEAKNYLPVFTQTLQQFPGMSLGEVWARIQLHLAQNPQSRSRPQNSQPRSLPQGRGNPTANGSSDLAPVTDSYDAILKDVMDRAGMTR